MDGCCAAVMCLRNKERVPATNPCSAACPCRPAVGGPGRPDSELQKVERHDGQLKSQRASSQVTCHKFHLSFIHSFLLPSANIFLSPELEVNFFFLLTKDTLICVDPVGVDCFRRLLPVGGGWQAAVTVDPELLVKC